MSRIVLFATVVLALLTNASVLGAEAQEAGEQLLKGKAAFGGWQQDRPGLRRLFMLQDLPPIGESTSNFSEVVPMPPGAKPRVPAGFSVEMVVSGLAEPRVIRTAPNPDLFVADSAANTVRVLRIPPGSAKPVRNEVFASGLYQPYSIAFYPVGSEPSMGLHRQQR